MGFLRLKWEVFLWIKRPTLVVTSETEPVSCALLVQFTEDLRNI